jgi:hypothetical protein
VVVGVVADLVAGFRDLPAEAGVLLEITAHEEERGLDLLLVEDVEDLPRAGQ